MLKIDHNVVLIILTTCNITVTDDCLTMTNETQLFLY